MKLTQEYLSYEGTQYLFEYEDADSFEHLPYGKCTQVYGVCFYEDKMVIVHHGEKKHWGLVGDTIEIGETFEETLIREIKEESNMEVLDFLPVGYQKVINIKDNSYIYQLRYVCVVKPYGPFVSDPAGSITKIALINPSDYKKYFDWGNTGERIIQRARELVVKN